MRLAVLINVRDRPTEISMLLESLMLQDYQEFDIYILDDCSGTPLNNYHFLNCTISLMRRKGFNVFLKRTSYPHGVSKARQKIVDWALKKDYKYLMRVDDDVILEPDFISRLIRVIGKGYDIASGVTPPMINPTFIRDTKYFGDVINRVILDKEGNYIFNGDDCGMQYTESKIFSAHHFRSSALYKAEIHKKVNYTPTRLSKHGFREEQIFSYKALMEGYKIGVDTGAIAWHQLTPSGGERFQEGQTLINHNQQILVNFTKENADKLNKIFKPYPKWKKELQKETNLAK